MKIKANNNKTIIASIIVFVSAIGIFFGNFNNIITFLEKLNVIPEKNLEKPELFIRILPNNDNKYISVEKNANYPEDVINFYVYFSVENTGKVSAANISLPDNVIFKYNDAEITGTVTTPLIVLPPGKKEILKITIVKKPYTTEEQKKSVEESLHKYHTFTMALVYENIDNKKLRYSSTVKYKIKIDDAKLLSATFDRI